MADIAEVNQSIVALADDMQAYLNGVHGHFISIADALGYVKAHMDNRDNPHEVTKEQLGLGYLQNYPVANRDQALQGDNNEVFMTALRSHEAMEPLVDALIDAFEQGTAALQT